MSKDILYFAVAVGILLAVGGLIFFFTQQRNQEKEVQTPMLSPVPVEQEVQEEQGLGSELYENPAAKVPETNPLGGYLNPFE